MRWTLRHSLSTAASKTQKDKKLRCAPQMQGWPTMRHRSKLFIPDSALTEVLTGHACRDVRQQTWAPLLEAMNLAFGVMKFLKVVSPVLMALPPIGVFASIHCARIHQHQLKSGRCPCKPAGAAQPYSLARHATVHSRPRTCQKTVPARG